MKKTLFVLLAASAICLAATSCQKEDSARAPKVPSVETIKIDLSAIPATKADESQTFSGITDILTDIWGKIYDQIINIPLKGFEFVADVQPVQDGNVWTWTASGRNIAGQVYDVVLKGTVAGSKINWELSVSRDGTGGFQNYAWITGWSDTDCTEGQWFISAGPDDTDLLITSDWTAEDGVVQTCKLTYNLDHAIGSLGAFTNGSYIEYINGASDNVYTSTLKVSYFQIGNISVDATIEWNSRTGACRLKIGSSNWIEI